GAADGVRRRRPGVLRVAPLGDVSGTDRRRTDLPAPAGQVVLVEVLSAARTWRARFVGVADDRGLEVVLDDGRMRVGPGADLWVSIQDATGVYCCGTRVVAGAGPHLRLAPPRFVHRTDDRRHARADGLDVGVVL